MTITVNGKKTDAHQAPLAVAELLTRLGLDGHSVLVELNGIALRPREFRESKVENGAVVEILRVAAGG